MLNNPQNEEGAQAFKDGKDIASNPYPEGHPHFQFFIDGFVAAANAVEVVAEEVVEVVEEVVTSVKDEAVKLIGEASAEADKLIADAPKTEV
jgi:hypothetical protein